MKDKIVVDKIRTIQILHDLHLDINPDSEAACLVSTMFGVRNRIFLSGDEIWRVGAKLCDVARDLRNNGAVK